MRKLRSWLAFGILCFSVIECAHAPPDVPACRAMAFHFGTDPVTNHLIQTASPACMREVGEPTCGYCVSVVTGKETFVGESEPHLLNGKPWSEIQDEAVLLPAEESYAPLAAYLINECKVTHCSKAVTGFKIDDK